MNEEDLQHLRRKNLRDWIDKIGGVAKAIEGRRDIPRSYPSYLSQLQADYSFGSRAARNCEARLGMPSMWLDQHHGHAQSGNVEPGPKLRGWVPLISYVQAGAWQEASDSLQPGEAEQWLPCPATHSASSYALRVKGESMTAPHTGVRSYPEGCMVFVDPERRDPANGARVIAKLEGADEVTFKVFKREDGRTWLQAINPAHPAITERFKVLGTVIGMWLPE